MDVVSYLLGKNQGSPAPTGTLSIVSNGTYDVSNYASANVNVAGIQEITDSSALFYKGARLTELTNFLAIVKHPTNCAYMFQDCENFEGTINISNIDFSNCTDMRYMFTNCPKVTSVTGLESINTSHVKYMDHLFDTFKFSSAIDSIDLHNWDVSNVEVMSYMFKSCGIRNYNLSNWDTSKVTTIAYLFMQNSTALSINFTGWDTSSVTTMAYAFSNMTKIETLDLSSFTGEALTNTSNMFLNSTKLTTIDMRSLEFTNVTNSNNMFGTSSTGPKNDCLIIVKDATQKTWITSKFGRLTNVKTVAEL